MSTFDFKRKPTL